MKRRNYDENYSRLDHSDEIREALEVFHASGSQIEYCKETDISEFQQMQLEKMKASLQKEMGQMLPDPETVTATEQKSSQRRSFGSKRSPETIEKMKASWRKRKVVEKSRSGGSENISVEDAKDFLQTLEEIAQTRGNQLSNTREEELSRASFIARLNKIIEADKITAAEVHEAMKIEQSLKADRNPQETSENPSESVQDNEKRFE